MKKISPQKRKIILTLLLISGICTVVSKKLAGDYSGFVFTFPIPGWVFMVDQFYRSTFIGDYINGEKLLLKNTFQRQVWSMPEEWYDDIAKYKRKQHE